MKKVLVFPCGSEIGLEINRSLADSTHFELYGASSVDDHGLYVYRNYVGGLPNISDDDCIDRINDVIDRYGIDFLFPAHDSAVLSFARNAEKLHAVVVTSPLETCEICRSKLKTYARLSGVVPVPAVYEKGADLTFPLFAKPDVGQGSRGARRRNMTTSLPIPTAWSSANFCREQNSPWTVSPTDTDICCSAKDDAGPGSATASAYTPFPWIIRDSGP